MKKMELVLKELPAPKLEGPADADVTLVGWGSSKGVIQEAAELCPTGAITIEG
jgi:2-oxoglutarate ferredoxin oxidoreductase subunit alpha